MAWFRFVAELYQSTRYYLSNLTARSLDTPEFTIRFTSVPLSYYGDALQSYCNASSVTSLILSLYFLIINVNMYTTHHLRVNLPCSNSSLLLLTNKSVERFTCIVSYYMVSTKRHSSTDLFVLLSQILRIHSIRLTRSCLFECHNCCMTSLCFGYLNILPLRWCVFQSFQWSD